MKPILLTRVLSCLTGLFVASNTLGASSPEALDDDIVIADFEGDSYAPWTVSGQAFGTSPAKGTLPGQMHVDGFLGRGLVNSFVQGDDSIGSLTSPAFRIERKFIAFLIGGGKNPEKLVIELLVDGKTVRSSTGPNDKAGGSEKLEADSWDVSELAGQSAVIRVVDKAQGGWGHINVDHIVQTDTKPVGPIKDAQRSLRASARYLHIPVKNGATKRVLTLLVDGQAIVANDIELADDQPDWWASMDISKWSGKTLTLQVDKLNADSRALSSMEVSDSLKDAGSLYREPLRGQFHFSPQRGWNNDPNGLVYYDGHYHMFFQHNPYGWGWGNMHWGHAISKDLVHWEELGDKLLPDSMGPMFSGSAVVDWNNTSGFGKDGKPPMVLIYTAAGNPTVQGIAYSTDGRTFTKYSGTPVLKQITGGNRDPKVIWHQPSKKWVMVLYVELQGKHTVHFLTSSNLREWTQASITQGVQGSGYLFECPDFFELALDNDPNQKKWVLLGANSEYAGGTFDGTNFHAEHHKLRGHQGRGFYAPQTFSDIPQSDGRRIQIGWLQTVTPGMSFNQSMSVPLELKLISTSQGPRLTFTPVKELESLREETRVLDAMELHPGDRNPLDEFRFELLELQTQIEPLNADQIVLNIRDAMVIYEPDKQELIVNGQRAAAPLRDGKLKLTIYCDRTGLEVFASDGTCYVPMPFNTNPENLRIFLETRGGMARVHTLQLHRLKSAWTPALSALESP